jgi:hypothetical protein
MTKLYLSVTMNLRPTKYILQYIKKKEKDDLNVCLM